MEALVGAFLIWVVFAGGIGALIAVVAKKVQHGATCDADERRHLQQLDELLAGQGAGRRFGRGEQESECGQGIAVSGRESNGGGRQRRTRGDFFGW